MGVHDKFLIAVVNTEFVLILMQVWANPASQIHTPAPSNSRTQTATGSLLTCCSPAKTRMPWNLAMIMRQMTAGWKLQRMHAGSFNECLCLDVSPSDPLRRTWQLGSLSVFEKVTMQ